MFLCNGVPDLCQIKSNNTYRCGIMSSSVLACQDVNKLFCCVLSIVRTVTSVFWTALISTACLVKILEIDALLCKSHGSKCRKNERLLVHKIRYTKKVN